jgi:hypothetical protein
MDRPLKIVNGKNKEMSNQDMDDVFPLHFYTILSASGSVTAGDVDFHFLSTSVNSIPEATGSQYVISSIYLDNADYRVINGNSPKLVLSVQIFVNDTDTNADIEVSLFEIIRNTNYGSGSVVRYDTTYGDIVADSEVLFIKPTLGTKNYAKSMEFDFPPDGYYAIGVEMTNPIDAGSTAHIVAHLKIKA